MQVPLGTFQVEFSECLLIKKKFFLWETQHEKCEEEQVYPFCSISGTMQ